MINRLLMTLWLALPAIASAQPNPEVMQAAGRARTVVLALDTNSDQQLSQAEFLSSFDKRIMKVSHDSGPVEDDRLPRHKRMHGVFEYPKDYPGLKGRL